MSRGPGRVQKLIKGLIASDLNRPGIAGGSNS